MKITKLHVAISMIMSLICCAAILLICDVQAVNENETTEYVDSSVLTDSEEVIFDYFEKINNHDWEGWAQCYPVKIQSEYLSFVKNTENRQKSFGILTINEVHLVRIEQISREYAPRFYQELSPYYEKDLYECYLVTILTSVNKDNGYFGNGTSNHVVIIVKDDGEWKIGAHYRVQDELVTLGFSAIEENRGIGYGLISFISEPTSIDVMDELGVIHSGEVFKSFVVNVVCNEIGNMGYCNDALKANIIAVKMCGWWAKAGHYREAYGCDIKFGDVAYCSYLATDPTNTKTIRNAVNALNGWYMISSSETSGKLFYSAYFAGGSNTNGQGTGQLRQNGSQYLATMYNYDWEDILHYYYDDSSYNNPNVGTVQISN